MKTVITLAGARWRFRTRVTVGLLVVSAICAQQATAEGPWRRHTIDDTSRGADGVRLADINGDGRQDLVCGWEEGGVIRVYLQPEREAVREPWPRATVGEVKSPEDAVLVDLDADGRLDVVSSTEGRTRTLFVHWGPEEERTLEDDAWTTEPIPCSQNLQAWMFALPMELDGRPGPELIVGSKGGSASVSMLRSDGARRELHQYRLQSLRPAGWIMSLAAHDMDGDGDQDVVVSDRKGPRRGVLWLENPGVEAVRRDADWKEHPIAGAGMEVMFLDVADLDGDQQAEVVTATRNSRILVSRRDGDSSDIWTTTEIPNPLGIPNGKAVAVADIDGDGRNDLIHTCNNGGRREHRGAVWLRALPDGSWKTHDISGERGVKFDLIQVLDIDGDGDLDWMTCEERDNLGLFWYENPQR